MAASVPASSFSIGGLAPGATAPRQPWRMAVKKVESLSPVVSQSTPHPSYLSRHKSAQESRAELPPRTALDTHWVLNGERRKGPGRSGKWPGRWLYACPP